MQLFVPPRNRRLGPIDALGFIGIVGLLVARYIPLATIIPFWGCGFRRVTGIPCPGCGLTRVADRVAHLNFAGALRANPLGTLAAGFFVATAMVSLLHLAFAMPVPELVLDDREVRRVRWLAVALFGFNYVWVVFSYTQLDYR